MATVAGINKVFKKAVREENYTTEADKSAFRTISSDPVRGMLESAYDREDSLVLRAMEEDDLIRSHVLKVFQKNPPSEKKIEETKVQLKKRSDQYIKTLRELHQKQLERLQKYCDMHNVDGSVARERLEIAQRKQIEALEERSRSDQTQLSALRENYDSAFAFASIERNRHPKEREGKEPKPKAIIEKYRPPLYPSIAKFALEKSETLREWTGIDPKEYDILGEPEIKFSSKFSLKGIKKDPNSKDGAYVYDDVDEKKMLAMRRGDDDSDVMDDWIALPQNFFGDDNVITFKYLPSGGAFKRLWLDKLIPEWGPLKEVNTKVMDAFGYAGQFDVRLGYIPKDKKRGISETDNGLTAPCAIGIFSDGQNIVRVGALVMVAKAMRWPTISFEDMPERYKEEAYLAARRAGYKHEEIFRDKGGKLFSQALKARGDEQRAMIENARKEKLPAEVEAALTYSIPNFNPDLDPQRFFEVSGANAGAIREAQLKLFKDPKTSAIQRGAILADESLGRDDLQNYVGPIVSQDQGEEDAATPGGRKLGVIEVASMLDAAYERNPDRAVEAFLAIEAGKRAEVFDALCLTANSKDNRMNNLAAAILASEDGVIPPRDRDCLFESIKTPERKALLLQQENLSIEEALRLLKVERDKDPQAENSPVGDALYQSAKSERGAKRLAALLATSYAKELELANRRPAAANGQQLPVNNEEIELEILNQRQLQQRSLAEIQAAKEVTKGLGRILAYIESRMVGTQEQKQTALDNVAYFFLNSPEFSQAQRYTLVDKQGSHGSMLLSVPNQLIFLRKKYGESFKQQLDSFLPFIGEGIDDGSLGELRRLDRLLPPEIKRALSDQGQPITTVDLDHFNFDANIREDSLLCAALINSLEERILQDGTVVSAARGQKDYLLSCQDINAVTAATILKGLSDKVVDKIRTEIKNAQHTKASEIFYELDVERAAQSLLRATANHRSATLVALGHNANTAQKQQKYLNILRALGPQTIAQAVHDVPAVANQANLRQAILNFLQALRNDPPPGPENDKFLADLIIELEQRGVLDRLPQLPKAVLGRALGYINSQGVIRKLFDQIPKEVQGGNFAHLVAVIKAIPGEEQKAKVFGILHENIQLTLLSNHLSPEDQMAVFSKAAANVQTRHFNDLGMQLVGANNQAVQIQKANLIVSDLGRVPEQAAETLWGRMTQQQQQAVLANVSRPTQEFLVQRFKVMIPAESLIFNQIMTLDQRFVRNGANNQILDAGEKDYLKRVAEAMAALPSQNGVQRDLFVNKLEVFIGRNQNPVQKRTDSVTYVREQALLKLMAVGRNNDASALYNGLSDASKAELKALLLTDENNQVFRNSPNLLKVMKGLMGIVVPAPAPVQQQEEGAAVRP